MVVVLGIDPGTAHTGYGVVLSRGQTLAALDGGVIETRPGPLERRLAQIHARVCDLISEHRPDAVAVEQLYFGQNARSAFAVGQARGVVLLSAGHGRPALLLLHAPGGQAGGVRQRRRRQGPGAADGRHPALPARAARARPRGRRPRRGHLPRQRRAADGGPRDRARARRGRHPAARRGRDRGRGSGLPAGGVRRHARHAAARRAGGAPAHPPRHARRRDPPVRLLRPRPSATCS